MVEDIVLTLLNLLILIIIAPFVGISLLFLIKWAEISEKRAKNNQK